MQLFNQYPHLQLIQEQAKRNKTACFLVGGFLRDYYLGRLSHDLDFALSKGSISFARCFARRIKGAFVLLDQDHGSARVVKNEAGQIYTYDFTDFRGKGITQDLSLRDFTVNTLCLDLVAFKDGDSIEAKTIDTHTSLADLKAKKIRLVSSKAFVDDPLRLLRAYSLAAVWDFKFDAKTQAQMKKDKDLITKPAMERVREEIFKILASPRAYATLTAMDNIELLPKVIPQVTIMYGVTQGGYHHLDVWKHSLEVLNQLEIIAADARRDLAVSAYFDEAIGGAHTRLSLLKLAALLHDVGKPQTKKKEGDRFTFHGHENVGKGITRLVAKHLRLSVKERYFLEDVVQMHLRPGYLSNFKQPSSKAVFRFMRDAGTEAAALAYLGLADQAATGGPKTTKAKTQHHAKICHMLIDNFFEVKAKPAAKARLLTGNDLIKKLKLKPSPLFAKILDGVEEAQALGKISNVEEALTLARKIAKV